MEDDYIMEEPEAPPPVARPAKPRGGKPPHKGPEALPVPPSSSRPTKDAKNPRRGRLKKTAPDEPAQFEPGSAAGPANFDPSVIAKNMELWWESGDGKRFILGTEEWGYARITETKIKELMRKDHNIRLKARDDERISAFQEVLLYVMKQRRLEMALASVAGYPAGVHDLRGQRILVRSSPRIVEAKEGKWEVIRALIEGCLNLDLDKKGDGIDQTPYFYSWLKVAYEGLVYGGPGNFPSGHCCIFAGPSGAGKGRLQNQVITGLFGGRSGDPSKFLFGETEFNGELFESEHLMMEEVPTPSQKMTDRVYLAEQIKRIVANDTARLRRMREEPLTLSPFWRLTISLNNDPDKMRSLPLITPDFGDKVLMFLVAQKPMPMPTDTLEQKRLFRVAIEEELPAFAHFLLHEYKLPEALLKYDNGRSATRFGFREFHHPELLKELFDDTPAAELLVLIDAAIFRLAEAGIDHKLWELPSWNDRRREPLPNVWQGGALDLEQLLKGEGGWTCTVAKQATKLCHHNNISRMLSRLAEDQKAGEMRVAKGDTKIAKGWIIAKPAPVG